MRKLFAFLVLVFLIVASSAAIGYFMSPVASAQADVMRMRTADEIQTNAQQRAQADLTFAFNYRKQVEDQTRMEIFMDKAGTKLEVVGSIAVVLAVYYVIFRLGFKVG